MTARDDGRAATPTPTPTACRHCPIPEREHMQRWTKAAGWHPWTQPTDAQRLARMRARRGAKMKRESI